MKVSDILKNVTFTGNVFIEEIDGITDKVDEVKENFIFVAIKGINFNGNDFIDLAIKKGAKLIVSEEDLDLKISSIKVKNVRKSYSLMCDNFFNNPSKKLKIIGVVGTCGKTSTTYLFRDLLSFQNELIGVIGTNGIYVGNEIIQSKLTTPDSYDLFEILYKMVNQKIKYCIMEVSAHAIHYNKIYGIKFEQIIFTNFSQDHLDFFDTMENYKKTKLKIFSSQYTSKVIINNDDKIVNEIKHICKNENIEYYTYGINKISNLFVQKYNLEYKNIDYKINLFNKEINGKLNLSTIYDLYNFLAVLLSLKMLNFDEDTIITNATKIEKINGRFDSVKIDNNHYIIIDYAHTPESTELTMKSVKKIFKKFKIITVFGCPGNRDSSKRKIIGNIIEKYSHFMVITADNPHYENVNKICYQIREGFSKNCKRYKVIEDRQNGIEFAYKKSLKKIKSVLLILGKGIENYQDINGVKIPYSDYEVIDKLIKEKI